MSKPAPKAKPKTLAEKYLDKLIAAGKDLTLSLEKYLVIFLYQYNVRTKLKEHVVKQNMLASKYTTEMEDSIMHFMAEHPKDNEFVKRVDIHEAACLYYDIGHPRITIMFRIEFNKFITDFAFSYPSLAPSFERVFSRIISPYMPKKYIESGSDAILIPDSFPTLKTLCIISLAENLKKETTKRKIDIEIFKKQVNSLKIEKNDLETVHKLRLEEENKIHMSIYNKFLKGKYLMQIKDLRIERLENNLENAINTAEDMMEIQRQQEDEIKKIKEETEEKNLTIYDLKSQNFQKGLILGIKDDMIADKDKVIEEQDKEIKQKDEEIKVLKKQLELKAKAMNVDKARDKKDDDPNEQLNNIIKKNSKKNRNKQQFSFGFRKKGK